MSAVAEKIFMTPDDLLVLPDGKSYELVDGELRERKVSALMSWVGGEFFGAIRDHVRTHKLGWVFPSDNGFKCFDTPKTVIKPDASFVRAGRIGWEDVDRGWLDVVPDLMVEVISPNDLVYEVDRKIEMYGRAGVPLIWVVVPDVRIVRVIRGDGSMAIFREGDELSGEGVLPGFSCPVASIFPPRGPASESAPTA